MRRLVPQRIALGFFICTAFASCLAAGHTFNVVQNGAVGNSKVGYNCAVMAGSAQLVCQDIRFASGDVDHAIAVYGAAANVNTTSSTRVEPGNATVTPASMANVVAGEVLYCADGDGRQGEQVLVTAASGSSFTARFHLPKNGTWVIVSHYTALYTTIRSVRNASIAVLATAATRSMNVAMVQIAGPTDNLDAIQDTINQACAAASEAASSTVVFPAGVYGMRGTLFIPDGCSYTNWTAHGSVVLLDTLIASNDSTKSFFGQGTTVLAFADVNAKGRAIAHFSTSIQAGSNLLHCPACGFTADDVGQPLYLEFGGDSHLPLWTTVSGVSGSPVNGIYTEVTLWESARTTLPLLVQGLRGPMVVVGYRVMRNIDIGGISFQNMGYWFQPGFTTVGYPLIQLGSVDLAVKQGLNFHDGTLLSTTNGCFANNGPNDHYTLANLTCLGMSDTAFYLSGSNSNGTLENLVADNTRYPIPNTALWQAFLLKAVSHVRIKQATVRCNCLNSLIDIGDVANFDVTLENGDLNGEGETAVALSSNLTSGLTVLNTQVENIAGDVFHFYNHHAGGIQGITITGTYASNIVGDGIWLKDGSRTGHGPRNIDFENNQLTVTGIAINAQKVEGTNHWSNNRLNNFPHSSTGAWQIWQGPAGATNYVESNTLDGYDTHKNYCESCKY